MLLSQEQPTQLSIVFSKGRKVGTRQTCWKVRGEQGLGQSGQGPFGTFLSTFVKPQFGAAWTGTEAPDASWGPLGVPSRVRRDHSGRSLHVGTTCWAETVSS